MNSFEGGAAKSFTRKLFGRKKYNYNTYPSIQITNWLNLNAGSGKVINLLILFIIVFLGMKLANSLVKWVIIILSLILVLIISTVSASSREGSYSFNQELLGKNGERIELLRNGSRPQAPKLNIKNADGTYDRTYSFSYG